MWKVVVQSDGLYWKIFSSAKRGGQEEMEWVGGWNGSGVNWGGESVGVVAKWAGEEEGAW